MFENLKSKLESYGSVINRNKLKMTAERLHNYPRTLGEIINIKNGKLPEDAEPHDFENIEVPMLKKEFTVIKRKPFGISSRNIDSSLVTYTNNSRESQESLDSKRLRTIDISVSKMRMKPPALPLNPLATSAMSKDSKERKFMKVSKLYRSLGNHSNMCSPTSMKSTTNFDDNEAVDKADFNRGHMSINHRYLPDPAALNEMIANHPQALRAHGSQLDRTGEYGLTGQDSNLRLPKFRTPAMTNWTSLASINLPLKRTPLANPPVRRAGCFSPE